MLGAAPTCKRYRGILFRLVVLTAAFATALASAANALSASPQPEPGNARTPVWGIALDGRQSDEPNLELLSEAKAAGLNAIVTDPKRWSPSRHTRLVEMARQLGLLLIEPRRPAAGSADLDLSASQCAAQRRAHHPCAVVATSASQANTFARATNADYVVVQLASPTDFVHLGTPAGRRQVISVLTLGATAKLDPSWDQAVAAATKSKRSAIAVGLSGASAAAAVQNYFTLVDQHSVVAKTFGNGNGGGNGPDRLPPTTPLGGTVTNATASSVDLSWIASTDNVGVAGYEVYVNGSLVGSTAATSFTVTGLSCGSTYTFGVDAYDKRHNRSTQLVFTGSTAGCAAPQPGPQPADTTPPTQPSGLTATGVTTSSLTLTWSASTDNVGVAGYEVSKAGAVAGTTSATSYLLSGLSCGTTYALAVKAYDAAGNRSTAATTSVTTSACAPTADTQAPSVPGNLQVTSTTVSSISLTWSASTDNVGVTGYGVYRNGTLAGSTNSTTYTLSGLACGTAYALALDAYDAAGNHSAQATLTTSTSACPPTTDTTAPTTPTGLQATAATPTSITVAWTASTDNVGVAGYTAYNGSTAAGSTTSTSYTVSGLLCGATYSLAVDAFDAAGNRSSKATISSSTNACAPPPPATDTQAPTTPTNLQVLSATTSSITVTWTASTDNVGVTGYGLYRGGASTGSTSSTSATFSGLSCGSAYTLGVDAYDAAGNRSNVATITASASTCPPTADTQAPTTPGGLHVTGATTSSITVAWTASTDNVAVAGYGLYRGGTSTGSTTSTSATFSGLSCGTTYTLAVDAYDAAGNRSAQASLSTPTSACPAPAAQTCGGKAGQSGTITHVVWVWMENHAYNEIIGSSAAPYTNQLATSCGLATNYSAVTHPSLPNYIAATSGSPQGITDDNPPSSHPLGVASIFGQVASGSYQESMTSNCQQADGYPYAVKHNPEAYYTSISSVCNLQDVPLTGFNPASLPAFSFVTPNMCNDTHDCSVATGDSFLQSFIPTITSSADYQAGKTAIFLTWDEDDSSSSNHVATLVISPYTTPGTQVGTAFNHYSLLRTAEDLLGVSPLGSASGATPMESSFGLTAAASPATDTTPPTAPGNLSVTGATASSISVSWSASTDNVGVTGYGLYRAGSSTGSTTATNTTFSGLTCGTAYTLAVDAYDAAGNRSAKTSITTSTSACADTQAPTVPSGLTATSATASSITVGWNASTDNVAVTGYGLYRNGTSTGSTSSTTASFSALSCGTAYTLAVDAYDAAGNRSGKAAITASTGPCPPPADTQAPTVPSGLQATTVTANSISLAWTASTDNVGVAGYTAYYGSSTAGNTTGTSYTVSGLTCGTGYTLAVDAYDAAGNRSGKATVSATTSACPAAPTSSVQPVGPTGTWTLAFDDEFNGTTLDTTKWAPCWFPQSYPSTSDSCGSMNGTVTYKSNVSVGNGVLTLTQPSSGNGALVDTDPKWGASPGFQLQYGVFEFRVWAPGDGTNCLDWNGPWLDGQSWPGDGEHDIMETLSGKATINYHSPSGAHSEYSAPGSLWCNGYHTYTIDREAGHADVYWDGTRVASYSTDDSGNPEYMILSVTSGGVQSYPAQMKVDYVRAWTH